MDALIGNTGFVGGHLASQHIFGAQFNSRTIHTAAGQSFGAVACAAAPGSMMLANRFPEQDAQQIRSMMDQLYQIRAERFVLISSIAVLAAFGRRDDEDTQAFETALPYGRHRRALETFCANRFPHCLIVRLPALFGAGLKKNFLFDILNPMPTMLLDLKFQELSDRLPAHLSAMLGTIYRTNSETGLHVIDRAALTASGLRAEFDAAVTQTGLSALQFSNPDSSFQYYDVSQLWADITAASDHGLSVVHLAPEPLAARHVFATITGRTMPSNQARVHKEDMRTRHGHIWGRTDGYIAAADDVLARLVQFFQSQGLKK